MFGGDVAGNELAVFPMAIRHADHGYGVVGEMREHGEPDAFPPIQQVTEISAEQHTGQEAVELQVESAE